MFSRSVFHTRNELEIEFTHHHHHNFCSQMKRQTHIQFEIIIFFSIVFSFIILNTSKNKYKCLKTFHQNCLLLNMYQNIYINNSLFCLLKATVFQFVGWLRNLLWKYMNVIRKISRIQFTKDDSIYNSYFTMTRRWHTCHQNIYKKITFLSIKKFRCKNLNK